MHPAGPSGVARPLAWQRPQQTNPRAVDAVEVAAVEHGVLLRTTLSAAVAISGAAWADFLAAVDAGEYDGQQLPVG